jgi:fucose 4-O-acetylase-like acetyltransferase
MDRQRWIDELRGVAIILVIVGHVIGGVDVSIGGGETNAIREALYAFHMPLFFMISGLVTKANDTNWKSIREELKKILVALYIPYLIFGYLFWGIKYFIYMGNEKVTITDALRLPYDWSAWVPGWYLLALMGIKLVDIVVRKIKWGGAMEPHCYMEHIANY